MIVIDAQSLEALTGSYGETGRGNTARLFSTRRQNGNAKDRYNVAATLLPTSSSAPRTIMLLTSKDGIHLYADAAGNPSNPAIVFLHGLSLSSIAFDNLFTNPKLLDRYYLVRYDMRGHGRSGKPTTPEGYLSARFAEDYATVAAAFNLKKSIFVGWSLGATVVCDIVSHLPSDTLGGVIYLGALPYIGSIMGRIGTEVILGFQPGLVTNDDVSLSLSTVVDFVESLFVKPDVVPFELKCSWMGCAVLQSPKVRTLLLTRSQDPSDLFKLGAEGLPLLVLSGTADSQVKGDVVVKEMQEQFKNVDFNMIEGGGHALFYEFPDQVINSIDSFVSKVLEEQSDLADPRADDFTHATGVFPAEFRTPINRYGPAALLSIWNSASFREAINHWYCFILMQQTFSRRRTPMDYCDDPGLLSHSLGVTSDRTFERSPALTTDPSVIHFSRGLPILPQHQIIQGSSYILPADEEEKKRYDVPPHVVDRLITLGHIRLVLQHEMIKRRYGNSIVLAPINFNQAQFILDCGTGGGDWLLDLASQINSSSILHGFDIHDKLFPSSAPSNVSFSVNSVTTLPQGWANRFDLVHQRLLKAALRGAEWPIVVAELFRVTRHGGWLQLVEPDKWNSGEATRSHQALVMRLFNARGMLYDCVEQLPAMLEQAGFTNVKVQKRGFGSPALGPGWKGTR
ncbi:hypothetical protein EW146_g7950 [Bondarzewia mesenterica]|uniref:AB hydrolase-1 domain-containing protein n=1 Tax=Bondarzewia mesenterica TaxID=1095465 RepID=A0A4S4LIS7_9AGAM|nr:hypothetical protein EW146_g7950 [Bondarzewia mesenterica]